MVIPRSRSKSILSRTWACISLPKTVLVYSNNLSANVLFPWSICAIIQKLRIRFIYKNRLYKVFYEVAKVLKSIDLLMVLPKIT